jgi:hypothetical protein
VGLKQKLFFVVSYALYILHLLLTSYQRPTKLNYERCSQLTDVCALLNALSVDPDCHIHYRIIAEVYII